MGCFSSVPEASYSNMDSQEERKFIEAQEIPVGPTGMKLSEQIEIFLSCKNLPKLDVGSPSDPFIVIHEKRDKDNQYQEIAKTELVKDNNNPEFTKPIIIDYHFEEVPFIHSFTHKIITCLPLHKHMNKSIISYLQPLNAFSIELHVKLNKY